MRRANRAEDERGVGQRATEQKMSAASSGERAAQMSSAVPASESAPEIAMQLLSHLQRISC
jgi:hypothetical protein